MQFSWIRFAGGHDHDGQTESVHGCFWVCVREIGWGGHIGGVFVCIWLGLCGPVNSTAVFPVMGSEDQQPYNWIKPVAPAGLGLATVQSGCKHQDKCGLSLLPPSHPPPFSLLGSVLPPEYQGWVNTSPICPHSLHLTHTHTQQKLNTHI